MIGDRDRLTCICRGRGITCNRKRCDLAGHGEGQCFACAMRLMHAGKATQGTPAKPAASAGRSRTARFALTPCEFLGAATGEQARCDTCGERHTMTPVRACALHGECTERPARREIAGADIAPRVRSCKGCDDYSPWPRKLDRHSLWRGTPGERFNPGLLADGDGYLFAARNGWKGSDVLIGRLDARFRPVGPPRKLDLHHPIEAAFGREDPRLFWHDGRVHVSYIGVTGTSQGQIRHTSQLYARLSPTLDVEAVFSPAYAARKAWEKNWAFFSRPIAGKPGLLAVYSIAPHHCILKLDGERASVYSEATWSPRWKGGEMRGGSPPVRVGDEYWHFFHDRVRGQGHFVYRTGLYTFDAAPPFRPRRILPVPILTADESTKPGEQYAAVVFCCGAVRRGDWWYLSHGIHDRWSEIHRFRHEDLDARLTGV